MEVCATQAVPDIFLTGTGMYTYLNILKIIVTLTLLSANAVESYARKSLVRISDHKALYPISVPLQARGVQRFPGS